MSGRVVLALLAAAGMLPAAAYTVVDDGIPMPLTAAPGDAQRGRAVVAHRQQGLCLLCHSGPIPEERFQGNLAPPLDGAGTRWTTAQLRLRVADSRRLNPASLMPTMHAVQSAVTDATADATADATGDSAAKARQRVGAAWRGQPVLNAQQVEDVVAYLQTLK